MPRISSITPTSASFGELVRIRGIDLYPAVAVLIGGASARITYNTTDEIWVRVPNLLTEANQVVANVGGTMAVSPTSLRRKVARSASPGADPNANTNNSGFGGSNPFQTTYNQGRAAYGSASGLAGSVAGVAGGLLNTGASIGGTALGAALSPLGATGSGLASIGGAGLSAGASLLTSGIQ
ncbi:hypothetical protein EON83_27835, partial [bacterium]